MTTVLLFAEHELNEREVASTLEALADLRVDGEPQVDVTVLVPYHGHGPVELPLDVATARGMSTSRAIEDSHHEATVARGSAQRTLQHVLLAVREGGHVARGELVAVREAVQDLVAEAEVRRATTVLVVSSPHGFSHLLHRDLEHRLRQAGVARVIRVHGAGTTAAAPTDAARGDGGP
jgi:hypothetical protein